MSNYNELVETISLAMGTSWASGINLYATLLVLGLSSANGLIDLPQGLEVLSNPMIIGASGLMYILEFVADKIPGVDTAWDGVHTFVRIPAGGMLAAAAMGEVAPGMEIAAGILGGTIATSTHAAKAGSRVMINTSPEPVTNWAASLSEDLLVLSGIWAALNYPLFFLAAFAVFIVVLIWLLPKLWQGIIQVFGFIRRLLRKGKMEIPSAIHTTSINGRKNPAQITDSTEQGKD